MLSTADEDEMVGTLDGEEFMPLLLLLFPPPPSFIKREGVAGAMKPLLLLLLLLLLLELVFVDFAGDLLTKDVWGVRGFKAKGLSIGFVDFGIAKLLGLPLN